MLKRALLIALCFIMLFSIPANAQNQKVPILLYHNIADNNNFTNMLLHRTSETFRAHMLAVKNAGYNTITYQDLKDAVIGLKELPENPIIISFDDGYESNYKYAYPVLKELGMKATIFVVTGYVGNKWLQYPHFSWEEALEMEQSGVIDIESHSHTHKDFSTLSKEESLYEIRMSKYLIEKNMGKKVTVFAYPYGFDNEYSQDLIKVAGYDIINYVGEKGSNSVDGGLDRLKRLTVAGNYTTERLLELIRQNIY